MGRAAANLHTVADGLAAVPRRAMERSVAQVDVLAAIEARSAVRGGRMTGLGGKLTTKSDISGGGGHVVGFVQGRPGGAWGVATGGAKAHVIKPRKRKALQGAGYAHPVAKAIQHKGIRGRRAWRQVRARAHVEVPKLFASEVHKVVVQGG